MSLASINRLDNRIEFEWLAYNARKLYLWCETGQEPQDLEGDPGFLKVVGKMIALDAASDQQEIPMKVCDIAAVMIAAWCEFHGLTPEPIIANVVQLKAWEAVARWLAYSVQCEDEAKAAEALAFIYARSRQEIENVCREPAGGTESQTESGPPAEAPPTRKRRSDAGRARVRKLKHQPVTAVLESHPKGWADLPEDPEDED